MLSTVLLYYEKGLDRNFTVADANPKKLTPNSAEPPAKL